MLKYLYIFFAFIFLSCTKDPMLFELQNLNNNNIGCFGHAGMGSRFIYPVNTLQSFEFCLNKGADGTEMDIQITKDSVLVIYHDTTLQTGSSCNGIIKDLNWDDISDCQIKSPLLKRFDLLSLDEFISNLQNPNRYIFTLDCKTAGNSNEAHYNMFARALVKFIDKYKLTQTIFIESPSDYFLSCIKILKPDAQIFVLSLDFNNALNKAKSKNLFGISMHNTKVTSEQIKTAHQNNIRVTLFGVLTQKENYSAVEKSPDFIQTDNIDYLLKIFNKDKKNNGLVEILKSN